MKCCPHHEEEADDSLLDEGHNISVKVASTVANNERAYLACPVRDHDAFRCCCPMSPFVLFPPPFRWLVCPSVRPPVRPSVRLCVRPSAHSFISPSVRQSVRSSVRPVSNDCWSRFKFENLIVKTPHLQPTISDQTRPDLTRSNQIRPDPTRSDQNHNIVLVWWCLVTYTSKIMQCISFEQICTILMQYVWFLVHFDKKMDPYQRPPAQITNH